MSRLQREKQLFLEWEHAHLIAPPPQSTMSMNISSIYMVSKICKYGFLCIKV